MMRYLLDTCVLSEFRRPQPNSNVIRWMDSVDEEDLCISVISIGEIRHGIEKMQPSVRRNDLALWLEKGLIPRFDRRVIMIDIDVMLVWGPLMAKTEKAGKKMSAMDGLIAATALTKNLTLVTRNINDFSVCGVQLINPWD